MIDTSQFSGRYAEIVSHYVRFLGRIPRQVFTYSGLANKNIPDPIYVLEFNPLNDDLENYDWIYVTVGASTRPMSYSPDIPSTAGEHRIELMINSREANRQLADALCDLAAYPFVVNTWLGVGHTIMGTPGQGIVDGSPLTDIFLTIPHITEKVSATSNIRTTRTAKYYGLSLCINRSDFSPNKTATGRWKTFSGRRNPIRQI